MVTNNNHQIVIWGASGHAMVVADIIRLRAEFILAGFLDDMNPNLRGTAFCGSTVLGGREQLSWLLEQNIRHIVIGFGNCKRRMELTKVLQSMGFIMPVVIHPQAVVATDVRIGAGTVIAAGAVVNPGVRIGESAIINTSATVDHECVIEDGVHICPGSLLAGCVMVGEATWVGVGAVVSDHIHIGASSLIGAGSVVVRDIPSCVVAYGVPAKVIREIEQ